MSRNVALSRVRYASKVSLRACRRSSKLSASFAAADARVCKIERRICGVDQTRLAAVAALALEGLKLRMSVRVCAATQVYGKSDV